MNTKTLGIFSAAALLSVASLAFVTQSTPRPQPAPPLPIAQPDPKPLQPQSVVHFGRSPVQATARISQALLPAGQESDIFINVDLQADQIGSSEQSVATVLLIDSSGSMSGQKIISARQAARAYISRLRDQDLCAVISYGSAVETVFPLQPVGPARAYALQRVRSIYPRGGTNISAALASANRTLAGVLGAKRVLLISDGRPTEGTRSTYRLAKIAGRGRQQGLSVSSIGVGLDYDEDVMERIALSGGGNFHHLTQVYALEGILRAEFASMKTLAASQVALSLRPAPGVQIDEIYGYSSQAQGQAQGIDLGDLSSGEQRRVVIRARAYADKAPRLHDLVQLSLRFVSPQNALVHHSTAQLSFASTQDQQLASASQDSSTLVATSQAQAADALSRSMQDLAKNERTGAVKTLTVMRRKLREAAKKAPAAAAPAMEAQAAMLDEMEDKAQSADLGAASGRAFVKENRAAAFQSLH